MSQQKGYDMSHHNSKKVLCCNMFLFFPVVPDVLHVVIVFHGIDELLHHHSLVVVQGLIVLGNHLDLSGDKGVLAQVGNYIVEVIGSGVDGFDC